MPITSCTITGNVKNLLGSNVENCTIKVQVPAPFFHSGSFISGEIQSTATNSSGNFSVAVIETATVGARVTFLFEYYDGSANRRMKQYAVVVPNQSSALLSDLIAASTPPSITTTFPATSVTVTPSGNLAATNAQAALVELQGDIDTINTLADGKIYLGNASNVATEVTPSGDVTITNAGVTAIASGVIVNADINSAAAIAHSKLADITAGSVLMGNGSNAPTATALSGDVTVNSSGVTAIGSGVIVNADVNASAAIAHSKMAALTVSRAMVTDGSGVASASSVTATTLGYLDATSSIQTQLDAKATTTALTDHINDATDAHDASAISSVASGSLAATDVQSALNELQTDIDTRATSSALTTHEADTSTHGVGEIVGRTETQTLTNKTISGASNTITNVSLTAGVTGTLPVANGGTGLATLTANNVMLGNGTSNVQFVAPSTSGNVLTSNGTTWTSAALGASALAVSTKIANYTLASSDDVILLDASGGAFTLTLHNPATATKKYYTLKKTDSGVNMVTLGGYNIDGAARKMCTQNETLIVYPDGTSWQVVQHKTITPWADAGVNTITAASVNPTKGTTSRDKLFWRRVGDHIETRIEFQQTAAGAAGTGTYYMQVVPTGWTADSNKVYTSVSTGGQTLGAGHMTDGTTTRGMVPSLFDTTRIYLIGADGTVASSTSYALSNTVVRFSAEVRVPITDWWE